MYTKKELTFEVLNENSFSDGYLELLHVVLRQRHQKDVHIIGVYRPPTGNVEIALDRIRDNLSRIRPHDEIILTGDFNINMLNMTSSSAKALQLLATTNGLIQLIDSPTRVTRKSATLIDLMFSNVKYVSKSGIIDCVMSDHHPVFMIKKKAHKEKNYYEKWCRPIKDLDYETFSTEICNYISSVSFTGKDPS